MSWEIVKLADVCTVITKGTTPSNIGETFTESGVKYIRSEMLTASKYVTGEFLYISPERNEKLKRSKLIEGDILFSMAGAYLGKTAIVRSEDVPANTNQATALIRVDNEKCSNEFVYYYLNLPELIKKVNTVQSQSAQPNINLRQIGELEINFPDRKTQEKVSNILSNYDSLIENNQKQIKLLEEAAQRLYKEWFVDLRFPGHENVAIVDGVPEGWKPGALGDVVAETGKKISKEKRENYTYYLPIDCIPKKSLGYVDTNSVALAESSLVAFAGKDIIFGAMRPYFHKVAVARDSGITRTTCFVLNAKESEYWAYVVMLLFSTDTVDYATQISVGTTMPYVRWKDFKNMPILIPNKDKAEDFGQQIKPIIEKINGLAKQIILLQQARDRLLPKLMSGEIEV